MRVPARVFGDAELLDAIRTRPLARAASERRHAAGHRRRGARDARHPPGLRLPGRRGRRHRSRPTASSRRAASATTSTAACGCSRCRSRAAELGERRGALVHEIARSVPVGAGREGSVSLGDEQLDASCARGRARCSTTMGSAREAGRRAAPSPGVASTAPTRRPSPSARSTRGAGQLGTLGSGNHFVEVQRVERVLDAEAAAAFGLQRGPGDGPDPLRLARARPPGLHGLREADGRRARPPRDRAARPPALLRADLVGRGPRLPRRDGGRRQLRLGQPRRRSRTASGARSPRCSGERRRRRHAPGLRRRAQRRQARAARRARAVRAPQGRDARLPARLARDPPRLRRGRPAGLHPGQHGHELASCWRAGRARWSARSARSATARDAG